ncbi:MAG: prepilin-type N-terminal cleavage/methylation domain-containing protein, partial [Candidatus Dadabacteria bacterium]
MKTDGVSRRPAPGTGAGGRRAFTLVELLVALAVAGVFLSLLYQAFLAQERSFRVQEDVTDARQNARVAVDELAR